MFFAIDIEIAKEFACDESRAHDAPPPAAPGLGSYALFTRTHGAGIHVFLNMGHVATEAACHDAVAEATEEEAVEVHQNRDAFAWFFRRSRLPSHSRHETSEGVSPNW